MTSDHRDIKDHLLRTKPRWNRYRKDTDWVKAHEAAAKYLGLQEQNVKRPQQTENRTRHWMADILEKIKRQ